MLDFKPDINYKMRLVRDLRKIGQWGLEPNIFDCTIGFRKKNIFQCIREFSELKVKPG